MKYLLGIFLFGIFVNFVPCTPIAKVDKKIAVEKSAVGKDQTEWVKIKFENEYCAII